MNTYEFQILRYRPDHVSEEFVNLGLVLFDPRTKVLRSGFSKSIARVTAFFPQQDGRLLQRRLRHFEGMFLNVADNLANGIVFDPLSGVQDITRRYLTPDDTSLYFTAVQKGMEEDIEFVFEELYERIVERNVQDSSETVKKDFEVWTRVFKPFFQELGIARRLSKHTVDTTNDNLEFAHAWKNEIWHCYEPVAFNLKRSDSIKNKVYKWVGKLDELRNTDEVVEIKLLTALPENDEELLAFILEKLDKKTFGNARVTVVTSAQAREFAQKVREEIEAHDEADENLII